MRRDHPERFEQLDRDVRAARQNLAAAVRRGDDAAALSGFRTAVDVTAHQVQRAELACIYALKGYCGPVHPAQAAVLADEGASREEPDVPEVQLDEDDDLNEEAARLEEVITGMSRL